MNLEPIIQSEAKSEREKQISYINPIYMGSRKMVAQLVKNLPALWESCIRPPGWEDSLEEGMASLQHSCLGNSIDRGARRAIVHGVTQSWT